MRFRDFLLNENKVYLSEKIGDLLTSLQNLQEDADGLSARAMERGLRGVVNQIRKILHSRWDDSEKATLLLLQKIGVGIMSGLDETDVDMKELVASAVSELERNDSEEPVNTLGSEEEVDTGDNDTVDSEGYGELEAE